MAIHLLSLLALASTAAVPQYQLGESVVVDPARTYYSSGVLIRNINQAGRPELLIVGTRNEDGVGKMSVRVFRWNGAAFERIGESNDLEVVLNQTAETSWTSLSPNDAGVAMGSTQFIARAVAAEGTFVLAQDPTLDGRPRTPYHLGPGVGEVLLVNNTPALAGYAVGVETPFIFAFQNNQLGDVSWTAVGDTDGDSTAEVIIARPSAVNAADPEDLLEVTSADIVPIENPGNITGLATANLDATPGEEILLASGVGQVFIRTWNGAEYVPTPQAAQSIAPAVSAIDVLDLADDGQLEVVTKHINALGVMTVAADGTLGTQRLISTGFPQGSFPTLNEMAFADLNGDGCVDVALTSHGGQPTVFFGADCAGVPPLLKDGFEDPS